HEAPPLIRFHLQPPDEHFPGSHDRQHMEMSRQGHKAGDDTVHQPPEPDAPRTTEAMEGDFRAESACYHRPLVFPNRTVVGVEDTLAATLLAWVVVLPGMPMAVVLEALRSTLWTYLAHTSNALLASVVAVGDCNQPYHGLVSRAFPLQHTAPRAS